MVNEGESGERETTMMTTTMTKNKMITAKSTKL